MYCRSKWMIPPRDKTAPTLAALQPMDNDHDGWWDSGWWIVMPIMMVVFWGGVIALVVWVVRQSKGDRASGHSPLDIAKERRAKGEISQDELEEIKRDLA